MASNQAPLYLLVLISIPISLILALMETWRVPSRGSSAALWELQKKKKKRLSVTGGDGTR